MRKFIDETNGAILTQQSYLYGTNVTVPKIPQEVIDARIALLQDNLARLLDHTFYTRDAKRCNSVFKAIKFWETINEK